MRDFRALFQDRISRLLVHRFVLFELLPVLILTLLPAVVLSVVAKHELDSLQWVLWAIQFLALMAIAALMAHQLARPLYYLMKGTTRVSEGDLTFRIPADNGDNELMEVTGMFNRMVEHVETTQRELQDQQQALQVTLETREREFGTMLEIAGLVNNQADLTSTTQRALSIAQSMLGTDILALALLDEAHNLTSLVTSCKDCPCTKPGIMCEQCICQKPIRSCLSSLEDTVLPHLLKTQALFKSFNLDMVDKAHAGQKITDSDFEPQTALPVFSLEVVDEATQRRLFAAMSQIGMRRMALHPVALRGEVLGVLLLMRYAIDPIPLRLRSLLDVLTENIVVLIENWRLQHKARELAVMEERRRMARELHDSVTQSLFTLSLTARGLKSVLQELPEENQQALDMLIEQTRVVQREMRSLITELRPLDLEANDLEGALRQHIQSLRHSTGIDARLRIRGNCRQIPESVQQHFNRIAQEALSNVARHSHARRAQVVLDVRPGVATLSIVDNGVGFNPRAVAMQQTQSLGLTSMRERSEMLGGALIVRSLPGQETSVTAQIPLANEIETAYDA